MKMTSVNPIKERIVLLDVLRGFALFGIFLSIIHGFNTSMTYDDQIFSRYDNIDILIDNLNMILMSKRFIGIFSLLFGIGIAIQQKRISESNKNFTAYFIKRMLVLALLGLVNTTFFFWAEILLIYSLFGLIVLTLKSVNYKILLGLSVLIFCFWHPFFEFFIREYLWNQFEYFPLEYPFERVKEVYVGGYLTEMIRLRWIEYSMLLTSNSFHMGVSFAMVILGYVIGSRGLHNWFIANFERLRKVFQFTFLYAMVFAVYALVTQNVSFGIYAGWIPYLVYLIFLLSSMFTYVYLITKFHFRSKKVVFWLANNGRLSLTGYMGVACLYAFIFHNNGFGLYLKYAAFGQFIIAILAYMAFSVFSTIWLKRFDHGPLEKFYRRISYSSIFNRNF